MKIAPKLSKRLGRLLKGLMPNSRCDSPRQVDVELSNRCNLRCGMCWFHGEGGVGDQYQGQELTTSEVFGLVDQLAQYNPHMGIYMGGGEPYVREDFPAVLRHIKSRNLSVSFTTNGTLLDSQRIEELVSLGVDAVSFSIDGYEELHDQVRGKGVFRKVTESVKKLSACKARNACTRPVINVNITITGNLAGRLSATLQAIREATDDGADFYRLHHQWFVTPDELSAHQSVIQQKLGCRASGAAGHLAPSSRILDPFALAEELVSVRREPKVIMFPELNRAGIVEYYSERPCIDRVCNASLLAAVIKPGGNVTFCPDEWIDDYILGNVRKDSFSEIWCNEKARRFRDLMKTEKHFQGCNRCSWMYSYRT